jgi:hypothetical protein
MFSPETFKKISFNLFILALLAAASAFEVRAGKTENDKAPAEKASSNKASKQQKATYGVIRGLIIDEKGGSLSRAVVSIFRAGTLKIIKQVATAADGSFLTRVLPGTYSLLARADGYDSVSLNDVEVARGGTEVYYGLKMERAGNGRTFAEKKIDRNNPKWAIRAAQNQRSIYQANEGKDSTVAAVEAANTEPQPGSDENQSRFRGQSLVETYAASSFGGEPYIGLNFATIQPLSENSKLIISGQLGTSNRARTRLETAYEAKLGKNHQVHFSGGMARLGTFKPADGSAEKELGQVSFQAYDQWQVREGFIVVYGFDYARFIGDSHDEAISPRLGVQYDLNARTRLGASYTGSNEDRVLQSSVVMEGEPILFHSASAGDTASDASGRPVMNKNRRFEIGIERVLDNRSSIEAAAFFDTFSGRGVGLIGLPMGFLSSSDNDALMQTVNQSGRAEGIRITYNRRLSKVFSAGAGYAYGRGQKLTAGALTDPQSLFDNDIFQTFMAQFSADLQRGTKVKTVFRLSPQATVFAIDPFAGKMAIYDPSISILIVQSLPTWGLPFRAEAVIDARNLLDYAIQSQTDDGTLKLGSSRRGIRGGISVRF